MAISHHIARETFLATKEEAPQGSRGAQFVTLRYPLMHQLTDLKMIFSFGNDVEVLVELHVVALSIVTDDTSNFVFIGLNV